MLRTSGGIIDHHYIAWVMLVIYEGNMYCEGGHNLKNSLLHTTQIVEFECCELFELSSGLLEAARPGSTNPMQLIR